MFTTRCGRIAYIKEERALWRPAYQEERRQEATVNKPRRALFPMS
jgi:hypothetical protein